jgi:hypothetical protein
MNYESSPRRTPPIGGVAVIRQALLLRRGNTRGGAALVS